MNPSPEASMVVRPPPRTPEFRVHAKPEDCDPRGRVVEARLAEWVCTAARLASGAPVELRSARWARLPRDGERVCLRVKPGSGGCVTVTLHGPWTDTVRGQAELSILS